MWCVGRAWNDGYFVFSQIYAHRESRVSRCIVIGRNEFPSFTFQFVFATCFPGITETCQCSIGDLQFVLAKETHNAQLRKCRKKRWARSSYSSDRLLSSLQVCCFLTMLKPQWNNMRALTHTRTHAHLPTYLHTSNKTLLNSQTC